MTLSSRFANNERVPIWAGSSKIRNVWLDTMLRGGKYETKEERAPYTPQPLGLYNLKHITAPESVVGQLYSKPPLIEVIICYGMFAEVLPPP